MGLTTNRIYSNHDRNEQDCVPDNFAILLYLPEYAICSAWSCPLSEKKFVPAQRFSGMQVIDSKGLLVGNVKDISVNFHEQSLAFLVATKNHTDLDVPWEDVLSVQDVVLLKKEIVLQNPTEEKGTEPASSPVVQAVLICPNCGASAPGRAKFCPKCGHSLR